MFKSRTSQLPQYHNVQVSDISIAPIPQSSSLRSRNCPNITMLKSQIGGLALNRRKWPEMGPEGSPGPENRPPGMLRPFSRLWDRSRGPNPPKYSPNSRSTAPGGRYWSECGTWSHAVISSLGARARGGVGRAPMFPCRTLSDLDYPGLGAVTCDVSSLWVLIVVK